MINRNYDKDIKELISELEANIFIPKRFRKSTFTDEKRLMYIEYLKKELIKLGSSKRN